MIRLRLLDETLQAFPLRWRFSTFTRFLSFVPLLSLILFSREKIRSEKYPQFLSFFSRAETNRLRTARCANANSFFGKVVTSIPRSSFSIFLRTVCTELLRTQRRSLFSFLFSFSFFLLRDRSLPAFQESPCCSFATGYRFPGHPRPKRNLRNWSCSLAAPRVLCSRKRGINPITRRDSM